VAGPNFVYVRLLCYQDVRGIFYWSMLNRGFLPNNLISYFIDGSWVPSLRCPFCLRCLPLQQVSLVFSDTLLYLFIRGSVFIVSEDLSVGGLSLDKGCFYFFPCLYEFSCLVR
jgi:hypothetical protein